MKDKHIWEIIYLCIRINTKAIDIYMKLSEAEPVKSLAAIWIHMAKEAKIQSDVWIIAKEKAQEYRFPSLFENPFVIKKDLEALLGKIDLLQDRWSQEQTMENALILVYRLEYHMLNPAFELLFRALKPLSDNINPSDTYDRHMNRFINMFIRYGDITPELELLGETLQSLWKRNRDLIEISMIDGLTKQLNRHGFFILALELSYLAHRKKENIAILMIDIDHFKKINDRYGHPTGDKVLRAVAQSFSAHVRKSDVICRYGGEEFVILFPDILPKALPLVAEKIRKGVEKTRVDGIGVTVSIGVEQGTIRSNPDKTLFSLISKADERLYKAKAGGRNCVVMTS
ncbi:MAG: GGDEF domain-containing protein [Desulfobacter sp.]|nr:GGDEF domain-containing protein [Desulfobacter sp.]